jgi:UDP-glucuronate 4-epimerase
MIRAGEPIPVFGDGSTRRDYTFVDDIVSGVRAAIEWRGSYEIVNLGNNRTVSLMEMIDGLEAAVGRKALIKRLPEQAGDVPQTWADISKAQRILGYAPRTSYEEGVRKFCQWLSESNP